MELRKTFETHIDTEEAYRLICLFNSDMGGQNAISARGWIMHSSWYNDRMTLTDGSYIYREPFVDAHLIHSNITASDVLNQLLDYSINPFGTTTIAVKGGAQ